MSDDAAGLTESEFLAAQADDAKRAMARALADLKAPLIKAVDPRGVIHEHPWASVGTAAVAGFTAAVALVPSKEQRALRRLAAIERALDSARHTTSPQPHTNGDHGDPQKKSLAVTLIHELFGVLKPAIVSVVTGLVQNRVSDPPEDGDPNDPASYQQA